MMFGFQRTNIHIISLHTRKRQANLVARLEIKHLLTEKDRTAHSFHHAQQLFPGGLGAYLMQVLQDALEGFLFIFYFCREDTFVMMFILPTTCRWRS